MTEVKHMQETESWVPELAWNYKLKENCWQTEKKGGLATDIKLDQANLLSVP